MVWRSRVDVDVGLDGAHADEEIGGDRAVGLAGGYELEDFSLALAQGFGKTRIRRRCVRGVPFDRRQELPEVVCRDGRVRASSLLSFEYPGEELGHRGSLVDEGSYVAFRFGQTEGLCQGVCRSLFLALCPQSQRLERQYLYLPAHRLCRLVKLRQQPQRFPGLVSGDEQPCEEHTLQRPRVGPDFAHARRPFLLGRGGRQISPCQMQPCIPDRSVDDCVVDAGAVSNPFGFLHR